LAQKIYETSLRQRLKRKKIIHWEREMDPNGTQEKITVEFMNGADDGTTVECDTFPITIGRGKDNVIHVAHDHLVSRYHARIVMEKNRLLLSDLRSTNGTFVGRQRVRTSAAIESHKLFRVGATQLMIKTRR
jgi:pSer/pThr/pTyr-binding forkhead associated (FHA) protein